MDTTTLGIKLDLQTRNRLDETVTEPPKLARATAAGKANLALLRKEIKSVLDILRR